MKKASVYIPEPCHENWSGMTPTEQGKFCGKCKKEVIDFTDYSDEKLENTLLDLYQQRNNVCGRFNNHQLSSSESHKILVRIPYKKLSYHQRFLVSLCIVFFLGGLSSCKTVDKTVGDVVIAPQIEMVDTTEIKTMGEVIQKQDSVSVLKDEIVVPFVNGFVEIPYITGGAPMISPQNFIGFSTISSLCTSPVKMADNVLLFKTESFALGEKQTNALDALVIKLKKSKKKYSIELIGHTDNRGSSKYNKTLSYNRARAVKKYLEQKGLKVKITRGVGYQFPVSSNTSMVGRESNRRVEVLIKYSKIETGKVKKSGSQKKKSKK